MSQRSREEIVEQNKKLSARVEELIAQADKAQKEGRLDDMRAFDKELDMTREKIRANFMELIAMENEQGENKQEKARPESVEPRRDDDEGR